MKDNDDQEYRRYNINMTLTSFDFDPLFFDIRSRLHFTIKCYARVVHENQFNQSDNNYQRWVNGKRDIFVDAIIDQQDSIDSILMNLEEVNTPTQDETNNIVNKISNIFVSTARKTFGKKQSGYDVDNSKFDPWLTTKCHEKRRLFHRAKRKYGWARNAHNTAEMKKKPVNYIKKS
ncbi:unnamed protein product [Mytilus coruscus]|uniref:Uncharacterized protein n=1 Tax=Mytilus coruscus TaxID=42192 RepID=A0A6J8AYS6_MYTCO|nr:unnamed protein product [Mytilus coruscus]